VLKKERRYMSPEKLENHIERLYKEYEAKKVKQEKLKEDYYKETCPHKPEVNDNSEPKIGNFYSRLQSWLTKKKEKDEKRKEISNIDPKTNKPLFTPDLKETESKYTKPRPTSPKELVSKLHTEGNDINMRRKTLLDENINQIKQISEKVVTSPKSKNLNEKNKSELFRKIFQILDYNDDGIIRYDEDFDEAMRNVPPHIAEILQPLFDEFRENKEILTLKEFIVSCGRLYNILDYYERSQLFQYIFYVKKLQSSRTFKKNEEFEVEKKNFSYQPAINDGCKKLFNKSEKYTGTTFLERNSQYLETRKRVIQEGLDKQIATEKIGKTKLVKLNYI
jgi:hypothetical protein